MDALFDALRRYSFIDNELKSAIEMRFEPVEFKKDEVLLKAGSKANYLFFLDKGLIHNSYFHQGREISSWFYREGQFVTSWHSFYSQSAGFEQMTALEDTRAFQVSYTDYQELIADFPAFNNFARSLAEFMLTYLDHFSKGWSFYTAREKYEILFDYFPNIDQRVKLGLIASFLGITQETLSRIRGKSS